MAPSWAGFLGVYSHLCHLQLGFMFPYPLPHMGGKDGATSVVEKVLYVSFCQVQGIDKKEPHVLIW